MLALAGFVGLALSTSLQLLGFGQVMESGHLVAGDGERSAGKSSC
jgi:hypothetical protein